MEERAFVDGISPEWQDAAILGPSGERTASTKALRQEVPGVFEKQQGTSVVEWGGEQSGRTEFPILAPQFLAE